MTIQTGITTNRKALATRISEQLLDAPVTYAGVPTCAYKVGAVVTIDRQGNIEVNSDDALSILKPFFIEQGWMEAEPVAEPMAEADETGETTVSDEPDAESETNAPDEPDEVGETQAPNESDAESETIAPDESDEAGETITLDEPDTPAIIDEDLKATLATGIDPERLPEIENCTISIPAELTVPQLTNLVHMLYRHQRLLNRAAMDGRLTIPEALITRLKEYTPETPEAFSELLRDLRALDELAGFDYEGGVVHLDFPHDEAHPERWMAYAGLVGRIIHAAKEATRVKAVLQTSENEKYYMRAWLLRLGYGGADLKAERKLLLQNLNGHSAFPNEATAARHKEKYAALRRAGREANSCAE